MTLLVTMVMAPVPVSLDGPSHVYSAVVIRHLLAGDRLYLESFQFSSPFIPNWLASVVAAGIALPGVTRWSIVVMNAIIIFFMAMALYYLIRRSGSTLRTPEHRYYILTILMPLASNVFVILGYWGFLMSAGLCFIAVGLLQDARLVWHRILAPILVLLGFWAHPVPVILTALIPVAGFARVILEARGSGRGTAKMLAARFGADILPWCIAGVLFAGFMPVLLAHNTTAEEPINVLSQVAHRVLGLARPEALSEVWPSSLAGGVFIVYVAVLGVGTFAPSVEHVFRRQLTVFLLMLLSLYLIVPDEVGSASDILRRILWMGIVVICVISVSGALALNLWYLRSCAICAATITILVGAQYLFASRQMEPAVQEFRNALANVPRGSKTLLLSYRVTPHCSRSSILEQTVPERHWALLEMIPRQLIVLNDYEPSKDYFPVNYREKRFDSITDEFKFTIRKEAAWRRALDSAAMGTFVLSWGVPSDRTAGCEDWVEAPLHDDLLRHYELRYENANHSRVQVWERSQTLDRTTSIDRQCTGLPVSACARHG